jgi:hypothetical protein
VEQVPGRKVEEGKAQRENLKGDVASNPEPNRFFVPVKIISSILHKQSGFSGMTVL